MITTSGPTSEKPTRNPWTPDDAGNPLFAMYFFLPVKKLKYLFDCGIRCVLRH